MEETIKSLKSLKNKDIELNKEFIFELSREDNRN